MSAANETEIAQQEYLIGKEYEFLHAQEAVLHILKNKKKEQTSVEVNKIITKDIFLLEDIIKSLNLRIAKRERLLYTLVQSSRKR